VTEYTKTLTKIQADLDAGEIDQEQAEFLRRWLKETVVKSCELLQKQHKPEDFIDPTGTVLTPSWHGEKCQGNGEHPGVECCCDECNFYLACFPDWDAPPV